jgi:hypothetical protein
LKKDHPKLLLNQHGVERKARPIERQKVVADRHQDYLPQCKRMLKEIRRRSILEIMFRNEEGTGLGPTLEFYAQLGLEVAKDQEMWIVTEDKMLFPRPHQVSPINQAKIR